MAGDVKDNPLSKKIKLGVVSSVHGIAGRVKIRCFTDSLDSLTEYGPLEDRKGNPVKVRITSYQENKQQVVAEIEGITTRDEAERLIGTEFYINRDALPETEENSYYHVDLLGLEVREQASGEAVGKVLTIHNFGAGDILEVRFNNGAQEMFLFSTETFPEIKPEQGYLVLNSPEKLLAKE